ncbi:mga helix-turn-helix domain protein [Carnobacterium maltaromaticum LMA28]|uniref:Mga helix-turn-helix domain protein n=1 Tax=Carnobacterium maltaromaticum LMA28 TaxID=1234679 RepID=R7RV72_CARML|nr:helix-turn-helix domain-containing protein [Carnobacterium maltaromaticum]CDF59521.1 mga helix-turn-helix domain protein [Carnobacterium maltaromaticum LMA28]
MSYEIGKGLSRQYLLLRQLHNSSVPLTKNDLSKELNCSRPTLNNTLILADNLIDRYGSIEKSSDGIILKEKKSINDAFIKAIILKETVLYQFVYSFLFEKIVSIESWAFDHFMSTSYVYSKMKSIRAFLRENKLELVTGGEFITIEGSEHQIRFLFFQLFKHTSLIDEEWLFSKYNVKAIAQLSQDLAKELGIYFSPVCEYQFCIAVAINLQRSCNDYHGEPSERQWESWKYYQTQFNFNNAFSNFERKIGKKIEEAERINILYSIIQLPFRYSSYENAMSRIKNIKALVPESYQLAKELFALFHENPKTNYFGFAYLLDMFAVFSAIELYQDISVVKLFSDEENEQLFANKELVKQVEDLISEYEEKSDFYFLKVNRQYLLKSIFQMNQFSERLRGISKVIRVTIISEKGYSQELKQGAKFLQQFTQNRIELINSLEVYFDEAHLNVDLILSDYYPVNISSNLPIFLWNSEPTEKDFRMLKKQIELLLEGKPDLANE